MSTARKRAARVAVCLGPGEGRSYPMGRISAVFNVILPEPQRRARRRPQLLDPRELRGAHAGHRPLVRRASAGRRVT